MPYMLNICILSFGFQRALGFLENEVPLVLQLYKLSGIFLFFYILILWAWKEGEFYNAPK